MRARLRPRSRPVRPARCPRLVRRRSHARPLYTCGSLWRSSRSSPLWSRAVFLQAERRRAADPHRPAVRARSPVPETTRSPTIERRAQAVCRCTCSSTRSVETPASRSRRSPRRSFRTTRAGSSSSTPSPTTARAVSWRRICRPSTSRRRSSSMATGWSSTHARDPFPRRRCAGSWTTWSRAPSSRLEVQQSCVHRNDHGARRHQHRADRR